MNGTCRHMVRLRVSQSRRSKETRIIANFFYLRNTGDKYRKRGGKTNNTGHQTRGKPRLKYRGLN